MKETLYLETIKNTLTDSSLIGDDCAYIGAEILGQNGIYVTQDSLAEDMHFSLDTISAYQLGCKSVHVNLSDLCAMCAKPLFVTISLSMPEKISDSFVEDFYKGVNDSCLSAGVKVVGGDLTGADKVYISVTAVGRKYIDGNISRSFAKDGDVVLVSGCHGSSAGGLKLLQNSERDPYSLVKAHLEPKAELEKSMAVSKIVNGKNINFAMMDTSDGLGDALFKIAQSSNVQIDVDFSKVPVSADLISTFPQNYKDMVLWGGEDYKLLCCIEKTLAKELVEQGFHEIGTVKNVSEKSIVVINDDEINQKTVIDESVFFQKSFNHFEE